MNDQINEKLQPPKNFRSIKKSCYTCKHHIKTGGLRHTWFGCEREGYYDANIDNVDDARSYVCDYWRKGFTVITDDEYNEKIESKK